MVSKVTDGDADKVACPSCCASRNWQENDHLSSFVSGMIVTDAAAIVSVVNWHSLLDIIC